VIFKSVVIFKNQKECSKTKFQAPPFRDFLIKNVRFKFICDLAIIILTNNFQNLKK
tara:strand:- start:734 stop:901 length:168 start_codon:yes stop_codon:yes gene_type:complete